MNKLLHLTRGDASSFKRLDQNRLYCLRGIVRGCQCFANREAPVGIIEHNQIGKCTSDIYPHPVMAQGRLHQLSSSFGYRLNGKISTCGERCWEIRPPSTAMTFPVM